MPRTIKIPVVVLGPDRHFGVAYAMRHSTAAADAAEVDDDEDQHHRCVCVRVCAGGGGVNRATGEGTDPHALAAVCPWLE
jgi:hypothetical protein